MDNFYTRCLLCTCIPALTPHLHIFSEAGNQLQLVEKLNYLNIQIEAELPQNVCHSCMEKLEVTHELVTSSQQARIMLLQMKQQSEEGKQENCSMTELDSYQPATDSAAIDNEMDIIEDEIPLDNYNCSAEDFDQSDSALHCSCSPIYIEVEETLTSKIDIVEHPIRLEPIEDQLDCLPQNSNVEPPLKIPECQVLVPKLLECYFCCFYSDNKTQLATHMQAHLYTPNIEDGIVFRKQPTNKGWKFSKSLQCAQCDVKYYYPEMLAWHLENCHGTDAIIKVVNSGDMQHKYQCVFCQTVCKNLRLMIRHLHVQHKFSNFPFHCNACGKRFTVWQILKRHQFKCKKTVNSSIGCNVNRQCNKIVRSSEKSIRKCKMCSEPFKSKILLKNHISDIHANRIMKPSYKCLHCHTSFNFLSLLKSHCRSSHPGKHILQCEICQAEFTTNAGYRYHKNYIHGNHVFTCNICSATFSSPGNLRGHMKNVHTPVKQRFACKICGVKFKCEKYLHKHILVVHNGSFLHCQHCNYSTRNRMNLISHFRWVHFKKS